MMMEPIVVLIVRERAPERECEKASQVTVQ